MTARMDSVLGCQKRFFCKTLLCKEADPWWWNTGLKQEELAPEYKSVTSLYMPFGSVDIFFLGKTLLMKEAEC